MPRQFVTCATEITPKIRPLIMDPHFWVIGLGEKAKTQNTTDTERDQVLAEAKATYDAGIRYIPDDREEALFQEQKIRVLERLGIDYKQ